MNPDEPMLLVIFGAGASYDSADARFGGIVPSQPPPLAAGLVGRRFDRLSADLPLCQPIIERLRSRMNEDDATTSLELELAAIMAAAQESPIRRQQLAAFRFHLYRLISTTTSTWLDELNGYTNYVALLNSILDWQVKVGARVRFVTFNYDELLEHALERYFDNWRFTSMRAYIERADYRVYKLHGSTNWARVIPIGAEPARSMTEAVIEVAARGLPDGIGDIEVTPVLQAVDSNGALTMPAIAVPLADKTDFECPQQHLNSLRADLSHVTKVLMVGWRAAEPHAVRLLEGENSPQRGLMPSYHLGLVSGNEDGIEETLGNLGIVAERAHRMRGFTEPGGFSALISNLRVRMADLLDAPH